MEEQGELFEADEFDSKEESAKWKIRLDKAKVVRLETDNALRNGTLVYASKAEESFTQMLNIIYGTLQTILSETLPYELVNCQTTGEIRDRLVATYNDIIGKGQESFNDYLKNKNHHGPEADTEKDAEPAA